MGIILIEFGAPEYSGMPLPYQREMNYAQAMPLDIEGD